MHITCIASLILGCQDSNLGYTGSKPDALPLGYSPMFYGEGRIRTFELERGRIYSPLRLATSLPHQ